MHQGRFILILVFSAWQLAPTVIAVAVAQSDRKEVIVRGEYYNYDYAYSVLVPKGLTGFRPPAPMPNTGFGIDLSKHPKSYLWVNANYNALEWKTFDEAIEAHIGFIKEDRATKVRLIKKSPTSIGTLRAIRFVIRYKAKDTNESMMQEMVLAFRRNTRDADMTYVIGLIAPESRYGQDRKVLVHMQRSWKVRRLP
jgi:hypothetical protein